MTRHQKFVFFCTVDGILCSLAQVAGEYMVEKRNELYILWCKMIGYKM